jgi:hypothetical protein
MMPRPTTNEGMLTKTLASISVPSRTILKSAAKKPDHVLAFSNRVVAYFMKGNNKLAFRNAQKACAMGICKALELAKSRGYCNCD